MRSIPSSNCKTLFCLLTVACQLASQLLATRLTAATFTPLGDLPGGEFESSATALSADGSVVVGVGGPTGPEVFQPSQEVADPILEAIRREAIRREAIRREAFRWSKTDGMMPLGELPGGKYFSVADAVSADGLTIVGSSYSAESLVGFRWTKDAGMSSLGKPLDGTHSCSPHAVSADGSVIVGTCLSNLVFGETQRMVAFRWTQSEGMVLLGDLPSGFLKSQASAVSARGDIIVGSISKSSRFQEAFVWTATEGVIRLGYLHDGDSRSDASSVSLDGKTIVGYSSSTSLLRTPTSMRMWITSEPAWQEDRREAFRWTKKDGMTALGDLPGGDYFSSARAVSADGTIVVGNSSSSPGSSTTFIWDSVNGMRDLRDVLVASGADLSGWQLQDACAISADGSCIVGTGRNPAGQREAWLARLNDSYDRVKK